MSHLIEIKNVTKKFNNAIALNNVSLDIYEGEILALLGANGAGKTTLSSIIASLHPPTSGSVLYHDKSIFDDLINYRKVLGFCPQKPNFPSKRTVREQLLFAGRYYLLEKNIIERRIAELSEQFDLRDYLHASPDVLSGGYKQRLLIARALIHKPKLVILDEPTVALDPHIRRQLWQYIRALKKDGTTVLLTTHYLDEAEVLADRVCVLHKGSIRLIDTPANMLSTYNKSRLEDVFLQMMHEETESSGL